MDSEDAHVEQAKRRLGTILCGKYTVDRILGVGGMAVVYAATHRNQKQVAIKMLHSELSLHAEIRKRFLREGYVANSVKHRGAVDVIDDDVDADGAAFIVMEYLDGAPVDAIQNERGGSIDAAAAIVIVHELCGVLAAAHAREIVHRDIKPANIFVTKEGELKVLDFGIARLRDSSSVQATGTGMTLGTPAFMAPEQARGQTAEVGAASDIWAAGVTLFNLLSGANIHDADNAQMMMIKVATTPPRSLGEVMPSLPKHLVDVVDRALRFDRKERWESAADMRSALREVHVKSFGTLTVERTLAPLAGGKSSKESERPPSRPETDVGSASTVIDAKTPHPSSSPAALTPPVAMIGGTTAFPVTASFVGPIASRRSLAIGVTAVALIGSAIAFIAFRGNSDDARQAGSGALVQGVSSTPSVQPEVKPQPSSGAPAPSAAPSTATVIQPLRPAASASAQLPRGPKLPGITPPTASPASSPLPLPPVASPAASAPSPPRVTDPGAVR